MIVAVTPNPAIDLTYTLAEVRLGESHRVHDVAARAGGKGVNVARVAAHGACDVPPALDRVVVVAPTGGAAGERFAHELARAGLRTRLVPVGAPMRQTLAVVTPEQTTNLNEGGTPLAAREWAAVHVAAAAELDAAATRGDRLVLVVSGSLPPGTPPSVVTELVRAGRERGAHVVADVSGPYLLAAADAGATVLKPNRDELLDVTRAAGWAMPGDGSDGAGSDGVDGLDGAVLAAARGLAARGGALVVASLGADGLVATRGAGPVWRARLGDELRGNTTGAGDAAVAALARALADGDWRPPAAASDAPGTAATRAAATSAPRTSTPHASAPDDAALRRALARATAWSAAAVLAPVAGELTDPAPLLARVRVTTHTDTPA